METKHLDAQIEVREFLDKNGTIAPAAKEALEEFKAIKEKLIENERYAQQRVNEVSDKPKKYSIDFNGNVLAGLRVKNNKIEIIGAMNGYGEGIRTEDIKITEVKDES